MGCENIVKQNIQKGGVIMFEWIKKFIDRIFESAEIIDGKIHCPCGIVEDYASWRTFFHCKCGKKFTSWSGPK